MIIVNFKTNRLLTEALTLESMGLPEALIKMIKEDLATRENQVRLALMLK